MVRARGVPGPRGNDRRFRTRLGRAGAGLAGSARRQLQHGRQGDAEQAAERAQGAAGAGGGREHCKGGGVMQQGLELRAIAGGVVADHADEPSLGARQRRQRGGGHGVPCVRMARARHMRARQAAGGEMGQQGLEAAVGAVEPRPDRGGPGAEEAELGGDDQGDGHEYAVKAPS